MSNKNALDQYYTSQSIVDTCWKYIDNTIGDTWGYIEPSAGEGAWLKEGRDIVGYDLEPKMDCIHKQDWLELNTDISGKVIVGNPPFGFASSLAVRFINHSFELGAEYVCFILPKTFMKPLFVDKNLTRSAELVSQYELPKNSFILDGKVYDVPCVFQIYKRGNRDKLSWNTYLSKGTKVDHDFIMRRVGGRAGKVLSEEEYTKSSSLFVKGDVSYLEKYRSEISKVASYTAGVKSITIDEINYLITDSLN